MKQLGSLVNHEGKNILSTNKFLKRIDELYEKYEHSNKGDVDHCLLQEELAELVIKYKEVERNGA